MNKNCIAREMVATLSVVGPKDAKGYKGRNFGFHSLFGGVKVLGASLVWALLFSCSGSKFAVYQEELARRAKSNQRTVMIHNHFNKR